MKTIYFWFIGGENAGDFYCNPGLFYDFSQNNKYNLISPIPKNKLSIKNSIIIFGGGGIYTNSNIEILKKIDKSNILINWGSGLNFIDKRKITEYYGHEITKPPFDKIFDLSGFRDFKIIPMYKSNQLTNYRYLPCVSCKLDGLLKKYKIKRKIGLVEHMWLVPLDEFNYEKINMNLTKYSIEEILKFIGESEYIITSSFHGMYWATLMNKKVIIYKCWSSKFYTFKYKPVIYSGNLKKDLKKCKTYPKSLKECIRLNDCFYKKYLKIINDSNDNK